MHKIGRFIGVGVINTTIDFGILNLLVYWFSPSSLDIVLLFSILSTLSAMVVSYFLNRIYAFKHQVNGSANLREASSFFFFALLALIANASLFLFSFKYLPLLMKLPDWGVLNLSKLMGVLGASCVSYLTYSFLVFPPEKLKEFRHRLTFPSSCSFWLQAVSIIALAALLRGIYLSFTHLITGDAVQYSVIAEQIASQEFSSIDTFWLGLFSYWEALFYLLGFTRIAATIIATLIPALLLALPLLALARFLYGSSVAWMAGLFYAFHPRLITWSGNGYAESFYLFFMTTAIFFLSRFMQTASSLHALWWGICMGICIAVRNEALLFFLSALGVMLFFSKRKTSLVIFSFIGCFLVVGAYAALSEYTVGKPALFQKFQVASKHYSEQLDPELAAKETYSGSKLSSESALSTLIERFPRNVRYTLERLPGVLLSPLIVFALLLPAFVKSRQEALPLFLMGLFPLLFYPLMQVEPRYLYPLLISVQIFGAAGLYALSRYLAWPFFQSGIMALLLLSQLLITGWIALQSREKEHIHEQLAIWIRAHTTPQEEIQGDGYGWISTTAFLAHRSPQPRQWTEDPQELVHSLRERRDRWLILYEPFLHLSNKALLPILDQGIPGLQKEYEVVDAKGMRYQIYRVL